MKDDGTTRGDERFTGAELADHVGISRRAVRYYVAQGLLAPPVGFGRGAYYTAAHAADLALIRDGQAEGRSLDSIRARLGRRPGVAPPGPSPEPSFWMRVMKD